jgi:hypothetical protein
MVIISGSNFHSIPHRALVRQLSDFPSYKPFAKEISFRLKEFPKKVTENFSNVIFSMMKNYFSSGFFLNLKSLLSAIQQPTRASGSTWAKNGTQKKAVLPLVV